MSEPFLGEIKLVSFNFPPKGWAVCAGQLLPINQNQALFALLGTTYGGDGQTNFALPDLRGRVPVHMGEGITLGQRAGEESHRLSQAELPAHTHLVNGSPNPPSLSSPANAFWATHTAEAYAPSANVGMLPANVLPVGGSQAHSNLSPFLVLQYVIALQGIFPSQN